MERLRESSRLYQDDLAISRPHPSPLTKVRLHPRRTEAVTIAEGAVLTRWSLNEPPRRLASLQADHAWFSDLAVSHEGEVFAVTTPENRIELRTVG